MASEALRKFAEELRLAREEKGITLQQISNRTKIDIKFLKKIEEGDFHVLPDLYIRAFLKEYLKNIEIDVESEIKKFELAKQGLTQESIADSKENEIEEPTGKNSLGENDNLHESISQSDSAKPVVDKLYYYLGTSGVLIVLVVLIYFSFIRESVPEIITETPYEEYIAENKARYEIDPVENPQTELLDADSLNLSISTLGRVWIKITGDKKVIQEGMVQENQKLLFKAGEEFRVVIGNAGLANITLNNKSIGSIGNLGEIKNIIITEDTIRSYTLTPPSQNEQKPATEN